MAPVWEEDGTDRTTSLKQQVNRLTEEIERIKVETASKKKQKEFKLPLKWKSAARKSFNKQNEDKILCLYLSAKGQLHAPKFYPLVGGNIIIIKNKAHEYIPSETLYMKVSSKTFPIYFIREIDRKPVSNSDWNEVKERRDSTRNDEVILKMLKLAMVEKVKGQINKAIWWMLGLGIAALIVGYLFFA